MGTPAGEITPPEGFVIESGGGPTPPPGFVVESPELVARQAGPLGRKREIVAGASRVLRQRDEDVDYTGIPSPSLQAKYSLISKPEDRTAFLKSVFGDRVTQDSYGHDVVLVPAPDGKMVKKSFEPFDPTSGNVASQYAGAAGQVLPVAGMVAGGVAGAPLGALGGMGMSAGGGAAGQAGNQLIARGLGLPSSLSSEEAAKDIVTQGAAPGAVGEGAARGLGFIGRSILAPYQPGSIFGPWERNVPRFQEQMADVDAARGYGLTPKVGTASPNARLVMRAQAMSNRIFGDETPAFNRPIIESNIERLVEKGVGSAPSRLPEETVSEGVSTKIDKLAGDFDRQATQAKDSAFKLIQQTQDKITKSVGEPSGNLAGKVSEDIRGTRALFGDIASGLYKPVDEFAGGPVVPTAPIKDTLKTILSEMPPTKGGGVSVLVPENLQAFAKGINELPDRVTFQQMQAIRHKFYSKSDLQALNAGLSDRQASQLASAADRAFDDAGAAFTKTRQMTVVGPEGKPITQTIKVPASEEAQAVVKSLRKADDFYKKGVRKFDDMSVEALVKDATQSGFIEPEKVARFIATPGNTEKLLRIKGVVSPETFQEVGRQTWSNILRDAKDPLTGSVDARRLSSLLGTYSKGGMLEALYGKSASDMRQLTAQLAAMDGKVPVETLSTGSTKNAIEGAIKAQQRSDKFMSQNWVNALKTEGPHSLQAAEWLTRPDNRLALRQASREFGTESPEMKGVREYLARRIFSTMEQPATMGAEKYASTELMGDQAMKELNRYGRSYLEEAFGKEWTDSAFKFARAAEVATRKNPVDSGGIIASMLGIHPLHYIGTLAKLFVGGEVLSSKAALDYLSKGLMRGDTGQFLRDMSMLGTRAVADQAVVDKQRQSQDYARGAATRLQGALH